VIKLYAYTYEILNALNRDDQTRDAARSLRINHIKNAVSSKGEIIKVAFDTRRFDQETQINPRRNLQNYHRSEPFIDKDSSDKIKTFFKLKSVVDAIKEDFNGDPDWLDSYCRILSATLNSTLRIEQKDFDFFKPQLNYLEELLYLRYRLRPEDIEKLDQKELRQLIIDRDERLLHKTIYANYNLGGISKNSAPVQNNLQKSSDPLIEKLFGDVKASKENPEVQRSVTITIQDKLVSQGVEPDLQVKRADNVSQVSDEDMTNQIVDGFFAKPELEITIP